MKKLRNILINNLDLIFIFFMFVAVTVFHYGKDDAQFMLYIERLDYFLMQSVFIIMFAFLLTCTYYSFITYEEKSKCCCKRCHCCKK